MHPPIGPRKYSGLKRNPWLSTGTSKAPCKPTLQPSPIPVIDAKEVKTVADFLLEIMAIDSTTGHEGPLAFAIAKYLKDSGWNTTLQPVEGQLHRLNVYAKRPGAGKTRRV